MIFTLPRSQHTVASYETAVLSNITKVLPKNKEKNQVLFIKLNVKSWLSPDLPKQ